MSRIFTIYTIYRIIGAGEMAVPGSRMRPRAVGQERQLLIRSGSGDPELQGWESERVVMPIAWSQR